MQKQRTTEELIRYLNNLKPFKEGTILNELHFHQNSILDQWALKQPHPVTLRHLANFGRKITPNKLLASANFVRTEIPIRLSLKIKELQQLPYHITNNHHFNQVYQSYYNCFTAFRRISQIKTLEENQRFCTFIRNVLDDHLVVLPHLMMGSLEISMLQSLEPSRLDEFMSSMIKSRVSRRVIMNQHISMSKSFSESQYSPTDEMTKPPDYIGDSFQYCSPHSHIRTSYDLIIRFMQSVYPTLPMPELILAGDDVKFQFLTNHLDYIITEILRNSLKATIENFIQNNNGNQKPPPVTVEITSSKEEIAFRFSDQGGGIPFELTESVWSFAKTPELAQVYLKNLHDLSDVDLQRRPRILEKDLLENEALNETDNIENTILNNIGQMELSGDEDDRSILKALASRPFESKLGISLPLCRVYTDYWNGILEWSSIEGYGSDVFLRLQKLGNQDIERLDKA